MTLTDYKEKNRERARLWRLENPEKSRETSKRSYQRHKSSILAHKKEYEKDPIIRERLNKQLRESRQSDPLRFRGYDLKKQYGITNEDYDVMLQSQNGVCASCSGPPTRKYFEVDHD